MTYKELERQIQNINIAYDKEFKVSNRGYSIDIRVDNLCYAIITNRMPYSLYIFDVAFENLEDNLRHDLLNIIYNFAQTPIEERDGEKKFYISSRITPRISHRYLFKVDGNIDFLNWGVCGGVNAEFTQNEIDCIKKKYNTDLNSFIIDEVEE